jgi:predicted O-methyltransferase YrrM
VPLRDTGSVPADIELLGVIREARRRLAEDGPPELRSHGDFERVAVPKSDGDVLRDLLVSIDARSVIEVGLAYGSSALAIAEALISTGSDGAAHLILDAFQDTFNDAGWHAIIAAGLTDVCTLVRERSQLVLPRLVSDGVVADAAFVDGGHSFHDVFVDLFFLRKVVRSNGLIILDDCSWPSVATAVRYFEVNTGWQRQPIEADTRLRAYRLPTPEVEPSFEQFEPFGLDSTP